MRPKRVVNRKTGLNPVEKTLVTSAFSNFIVSSLRAKTVKLEQFTNSQIGTLARGSANSTKLSPAKHPDSRKSDIIGLLLLRDSTARLN